MPARALAWPWMVVLGLAVAGCAGRIQSPQPAKPDVCERPPAGAVAQSTPLAPAARWLAYHEYLARLTPRELLLEHSRATALLEGERRGDTPPRLAALLAIPDAPFRDDAAAERMLREWLTISPQTDAALSVLVAWQVARLGERARLAAAVDDGVRRLRDERRRAESCREKLDAIKDMERTLLERDKR